MENQNHLSIYQPVPLSACFHGFWMTSQRTKHHNQFLWRPCKPCSCSCGDRFCHSFHRFRRGSWGRRAFDPPEAHAWQWCLAASWESKLAWQRKKEVSFWWADVIHKNLSKGTPRLEIRPSSQVLLKGIMVINSPLMKPYFLGQVAFGRLTLNSHEWFFQLPTPENSMGFSQTSEKSRHVQQWVKRWNFTQISSGSPFYIPTHFFGEGESQFDFFFSDGWQNTTDNRPRLEKKYTRRLCIFRGPSSKKNSIDFMFFFFRWWEQGFRWWAIFSRAPLGGSSQLVRG